MAEKKNTEFNRPGGYAMPKGSTQVQRRAAKSITAANIRLLGDSVPAHKAKTVKECIGDTVSEPHRNDSAPSHPLAVSPLYHASDPDTQLYVGDCRDILATLPERGQVDLIFADPPFNWDVPYAGGEEKADDGWKDGMPRAEYERFTFDWLDGCIEALAPHGSLWVNIPDDSAAEVVMHLKRRGLTMINWCIWHFRFGQNRNSSFIMSKVHVLYFAKLGMSSGKFTTEITEDTEKHKKNSPFVNSVSSVVNQSGLTAGRIWNPNDIIELSDRASIYADPRTMAKDSNKGLRVPMDVWYGKYWGRIQGNNKERRHEHHNQIPEIYLERVIKACSNPVGGWAPARKLTTEITENTERADQNLCSVNPVSSVVNHVGESAGFGSLVLDPFCGSGTTSTVARALGRRSITIEYSAVNAKSAWERITKVGMVPREDAGKPQSTAIFKSRRKRQSSAQVSQT